MMQTTKLLKVNRVELIDQHGRQYTNYNVANVEYQLQDDNKTLKVFFLSNEETGS